MKLLNSVLCLFFFYCSDLLAFPRDFRHICEESLLNSEKLAQSKESIEVSGVRFEPGRDDIVVFSGQVTGYYLRVLERLPSSITTVALELPHGGDAIAALQIAEKIREHNLNTYVGLTRCHSACTIIFQGGVERIAHQGALLTYHGPSRAGVRDLCAEQIASYGFQQLVQWGFPQDMENVFAHHAVISPLASEDLYQAGIATRIQSLNVGYDELIFGIRKKAAAFCKENPESDDC